MICGVSKKKITPPEALMTDLRGLGNVVFTGVLDDIYVRVMILGNGNKNAVLVVFDLDKAPFPQAFLSEISHLTGIPEANISILSIHTHTAPVTGWRPNEGPNFILNKPENVQKATLEYEAFLREAVLETVRDAMASRQPVKTGWGIGKSFVNVNRVQDYLVVKKDGTAEVCCGLGQNFEAEPDRSVFVMKVESLDGKMVACLVNYAVHNCVMIGNRCGAEGGALLSSDLGGNVSQMIEENNPGCVALWTSGAAGDINPIMSNEIFYPDPKTGQKTAYLLPPGDMAPVMMLKVLAARHYSDVKRILNQISCNCLHGKIGGGVEWSRTPGNGPEPYEVRVHLLKIGEVGLWGFSGELYSSLGLAIQKALPAGPHVILNHDASLLANSGYIFDDETLARDHPGVLPGRKKSAIRPGYVKDSLIKITTAMWKKHETESEERNNEL